MSPYRQLAEQISYPPEQWPQPDPAKAILDHVLGCPDPVVQITLDDYRILFRRYHMFFDLCVPLIGTPFYLFGRTVTVTFPTSTLVP